MRSPARILAACALLCAVLCAPARAADSLSVFADNNHVALGIATAIAAHAETGPEFGGGHVALTYKGADSDCAATPAADDGTSAVPEGQSLPVAAGQGTADVGGQVIQLGVGNWRICGWLVDDATGVVTAQGSTVVQVVPYMGSLSLRVERDGRVFQLTLAYSTSAPARLYASLQRATRSCPRNPARMPSGSILLVPRGGRYVGSDGGIGRAIDARHLTPGKWRVCAWLRADVGSIGPASKTFALRPRSRRGVHAAGRSAAAAGAVPSSGASR